MKKILAIILAMVMVLSLAACGSSDKTDATTNTETNGTEQTETVAKTPEELQKYYEGYFASDDVGFAGTCMTADTDGAKIIISTNKDGENLFSMTVLENQFEIYKAKDGKEYIHAKVSITDTETGKTESTDQWYKYVASEDSENKEMFGSMTEDFSTDELTVEPNTIKSVKYDETKDGIDYITVVSTEPADDETETTETTDTAETVEVTWVFGIDATTHKIVSVSQTEDGVVSTVTFSDVSDINVTIPETVEDIDEEGVMGIYMTIIFSMMADAMGSAQS